MTSSIFFPRRSRAWPEPRTHLTASTMLVFPEPLGPTIAVTPPSNRISVGRANVLKPSRFSERRNKFASGYQRWRCRYRGRRRPEAQHVEHLFQRLSELAAPPWRRRDGVRYGFGRWRRSGLCRHRNHLYRYRLLHRLCRLFRRSRGRGCRLGSRRPGRAWGSRRTSGLHRLHKGSRACTSNQALERDLRCLLPRLLLRRAVPGAKRLRAGEDHGRVLAMSAHPCSLAVVERGRPEAFLGNLLQPAFEVFVLRRRRQRAVAIEVVVIRSVIPCVEEDGAQHRFEHVREQRFEAAPTAFGNALAQVEVAAHIELLREERKGVRVDHRRPCLGQLALAGARGVLVEVLGRDQLEDRVAQVLQALVVARGSVGALIGDR